MIFRFRQAAAASLTVAACGLGLLSAPAQATPAPLTARAAPLCLEKTEDDGCTIPKLGLITARVGACRTTPRDGDCPEGQEGGTEIIELDPHGPLAKAGLKPHETIVGINVIRTRPNTNSWTPHALYARASTFPAGTQVKVRYKTDGGSYRGARLIMG
ncbi:hypothetical protein ACFPFX_11505 [Streptomyces mauvecolor]|uniref:PDZ domain-containing protein n=1 Tax=Streptomyces mauvecolor TaxID=58345 RepID=A0ABV9UKY5_9ACTN